MPTRHVHRHHHHHPAAPPDEGAPNTNYTPSSPQPLAHVAPNTPSERAVKGVRPHALGVPKSLGDRLDSAFGAATSPRVGGLRVLCEEAGRTESPGVGAVTLRSSFCDLVRLGVTTVTCCGGAWCCLAWYSRRARSAASYSELWSRPGLARRTRQFSGALPGGLPFTATRAWLRAARSLTWPPPPPPPPLRRRF